MFEFSSTENTEMNFYHEFVKEFNDQNKQTKNSLKYKKNNNFFFSPTTGINTENFNRKKYIFLEVFFFFAF